MNEITITTYDIFALFGLFVSLGVISALTILSVYWIADVVKNAIRKNIKYRRERKTVHPGWAICKTAEDAKRFLTKGKSKKDENTLLDQFAPYCLASELQGLGFNDKCLAVYNRNKVLRFNNLHNPSDPKKMPSITNSNGECPAPLWQQAFDFFREKYNLESSVNRGWSMNHKYYYFIMQGTDENSIHQSTSDKAYHQARHECLEHLIWMCKDKDLVPLQSIP